MKLILLSITLSIVLSTALGEDGLVSQPSDHVDLPEGSRIEISEENGETKYLLEGDIILTKEDFDEIVKHTGDESREERTKRQIKNVHAHQKWSDGVDYYFNESSSAAMREGFLKAAMVWRNKTCIDFRENKTALNHIYVTDRDNACYSHVGRIGGRQRLNLGKNCEGFGTAAHEIGHALGFHHFHARHDRDQHITVKPENIRQHLLREYEILTSANSINYGTKYDYGSIMHYGSPIDYPSMVPADRHHRRTMGSHLISFMDLWMINKHYGCLDKCKPETSVKCANGGFPHPRKCNEKCICPGGYGGKLCKIRPKCGAEVNATSSWSRLPILISKANGTDDYAMCTYWIRSPKNTVIEIEIKSMYIPYFFPQGCGNVGVEIKANDDHRLTGYRFCSYEDQGTTIRSQSNFVPIIAYSMETFQSVMELRYKYVNANTRA